MKLNEKGFAFSTMLYGSITLIAVVLYVILNVNKTRNDITYYFGEELVNNLNSCVTEEIALENCYSSGNTNCSVTAYHSCLGISENGVPGIIISEKIISDNNAGLISDTYENNRYIFSGNTINNYIYYSNKYWRIVSIEPGGYLKLIDINKYSTSKWDEEGSKLWNAENSLYNSLNSHYFASLVDNSKVFRMGWNASVLYPTLLEGEALRDLIEQEKNVSNEEIIFSNIGLLSVSDYLKATSNNNCKTNLFGTNFYNCNSWLSEYKSWVIDINGEIDSPGSAYYYGDYSNKHNLVKDKQTNDEYDVYPVIYLDRNSIYNDGNGSLETPYTIK